ncbi:hypothetical protein [Rhodobacter capsulatus]|uniref:hypothetical protein n=1 Tax=Rhodobacter capsulatus TaxID=1061 RepID=UPI004025CF31
MPDTTEMTFEQLCELFNFKPTGLPMDTEGLAKLRGVSKRTVEGDRVRGVGPRYFQPPGMRTIKVQEMADRAFAKFAPQLDKVFHNMRAGAELIEKQLSAPVEARAAHTISTQIRDHVKGMGQRQGVSELDKRPRQSAVGFVQAAIQKGDEVTVSAVLGAPAYLSGLTDEMQAMLLRQWHEKHNPKAAKRLRAMRAVMDLIKTGHR